VIPIRDNIRTRTFPYVTIALIAINSVVFVYQHLLHKEIERAAMAYEYGVVPLRAFAAVKGVPEVYVTPIPMHRMVLKANFSSVVLSFFTSMFMHGGLVHIIGNMLYLWIFGDNIEDRFGHVRFLLFYVFAGLCAAGLQMFFNIRSSVAMIGASGAVAGVLGAYLIAYPWARVTVLVPIFFFLHFVEIPAVIMLVFWFVLEFLRGRSAAASGVAHWAHVGGFVAGVVVMMLVKTFGRRRKRSIPVEIILPNGERITKS